MFASLFDDPGQWQVCASGQAKGRLAATEGPGGKAGLRLDYDFHGGGGFVVVRRLVALRLPDTFEIGFLLRGEGPPNHLEFKVAAPGGANVWRHLRPDFQLPAAWTDFRFHERELPFAWGPAGGGAPSEVEAVELVVAAGPGGRGSLCLAGASLVDQSLREPRSIRASSHLAGHPPQAAFDGCTGTEWRAEPGDPRPWWWMDIGRSFRFGGVVVDWPPELPPRVFEVEVSNDGETWTSLHRARGALGPRSHIAAQGAEAHYLRVAFGNAACAALRGLALRPDAFSSTPNEFVHSVAADFPRGWYPRYWHREQSYWTPVGTPEGKRRALINEEGMVEVDEAGFSLEPFVLTSAGLVTWADVESSISLAKGGAPLPGVTWASAGFRLVVLPWVDGKGDDLTLHTTYRLKVLDRAERARLVVALRPWQVNPPWQAFRNLGGRSPIDRVACAGRSIRVNDRLVVATPAPAATGAAMFDEGGVVAFLAQGALPLRDQVEDATGLASAAFAWDVPAGAGSLEVTVSMPYFQSCREPAARGRANALARWRYRLGGVEWQVPASARPAFDCWRTAAGHILINRDGPAIQPGPRRYTRSWVRDCVIMGAALAKAGLPAALREFLVWYAPFQRDDGFVPCVVDRDGVDWLVEHDSHGQFLWGTREVVRHGEDDAFLRRMLPHARKAADFLVGMRAQRTTDEFRAGERAACFGLLPESASHEGYLAHPVHSYWDDFWGVRGLEAAADLAAAAGFDEDARRWRREAGCFQRDLVRSIEKVIADKQLAYVPGSVEWADFDPTATANAIALLDFADLLPQGPLQAMLDTYLDGFRRKHRGAMEWRNYTAYEIRIIGAFVRLGQRGTANELLEFFLADRRMPEWNQWPEITWRDLRSPGHLGDVPHTWIAAEYILALSSMVAAEREASGSMVLAAGMPWAWVAEEDGFSVRRLPTRYGPLDFAIRADGGGTIRVGIAGTITLPPGGLAVAPPLPAGKRIVSVAVETGPQATLAADGASLAVPGVPFVANLRLGGEGIPAYASSR